MAAGATAAVVVSLVAGTSGVGAAADEGGGGATTARSAGPAVLDELDELDAPKAAVLGVVEGVTEYLPVSSTGHLHVVERLLDVGSTEATEEAADTYAITIQAGAILAVLVLYRGRLRDMVRGAAGRSATGRRVLSAVVAGFVPAALTGLLLESAIKDRLLATGPIAAAWLAGGLAILLVVPGIRRRATATTDLDAVTLRQAAVIGVAQVLALWPGTSRSLVTILAGLAVGLTVGAAVEYSFLLGLLTLGAATGYEAARHGGELVEVFGLADPLIGFVTAFVAAVFAVRWMVAYLQRRSLAVFGWYRIAAAAVAALLLATGAL